MFTEHLAEIRSRLLPADRVAPLAPGAARTSRTAASLFNGGLESLRRHHIAVLSDPATTADAAADSAYALLNAATWTDVTGGDPYTYDPCDRIDSAFAETCLALAMTCNRMKSQLDSISPLIVQRIRQELRTRMEPWLIREDTCRTLPVQIACDMLCAVLLAGCDRESRWNGIVRFTRSLDAYITSVENGTYTFASLEQTASEAVRLMDTACVLKAATAGIVDLTQEERIAALADPIIYSQIDGPVFLNPGASGMQPLLDAESLYRFGSLTGDRQLCDLSAYLHNPGMFEPPHSPLSRMLNLPFMSALAAHPKRMRYFKNGYVQERAIMVMRGFHMTAMMHGATGGFHADAGDVVLYHRSVPVLIDLGDPYKGAALHSVAAVNGFEQIPVPDSTATETADAGGDCVCYTVNLTNAYPAGACISDYQRTLLMGSVAAPGIRLMDMISLEKPVPIDLRFICAAEPHIEGSCARIGPVSLQWRDVLTASVSSIAENVYRLTLHADPAPQHRIILEFLPE